MFIKIIKIYKGDNNRTNDLEKEKIVLKKDFYIYHFIFFIGFVLIYIFL